MAGQNRGGFTGVIGMVLISFAAIFLLSTAAEAVDGGSQAFCEPFGGDTAFDFDAKTEVPSGDLSCDLFRDWASRWHAGIDAEIADSGSTYFSAVSPGPDDGYSYSPMNTLPCGTSNIICVRTSSGVYAKVDPLGGCSLCVTADWEITHIPPPGGTPPATQLFCDPLMGDIAFDFDCRNEVPSGHFDCDLYKNGGWYAGKDAMIADSGTTDFNAVSPGPEDGYVYSADTTLPCGTSNIICVRTAGFTYVKVDPRGECAPCVTVDWGITYSPLDYDADGDGLCDSYENCYADCGLNPSVWNDPDADLDADGLTNIMEQAAKTNPGCPDSDGDGFSDCHEVEEGSHPLDSASRPPVMAVLKETENGDQNLFLYDVPKEGDRTYDDAEARNGKPVARDFWIIPAGNSVMALTSLDIDADGTDELAVLKETEGDQNLFFYNMPVPEDTTYWDAASRNPSPLARDLWLIPDGNGAVDLANAGDVDGDGREDLAVLKEKDGAQELFIYAAAQPGDWTYGDAADRNPAPLALDRWVIPNGNDIVAISGSDSDGDGGNDRLACVCRQGGDQNLYLWEMPAAGDASAEEASSRQDGYAGDGTPQARDLWIIPAGNSIVALGSAAADGADGDELCVMKDEGGDRNFYVHALPKDGDSTYWDAAARNPVTVARDFWIIPETQGKASRASG